MKIIDTSRTQPKIIDTSPTQPKVDPEEVAQALGAEPMNRPPYVFANFPQDVAQRLSSSPESGRPNPLGLTKEEWAQLQALAHELTEGEKKPTPEQVARAIVRQTLALLSKQQLKASLWAEEAPAAK